MRTAIPGAIFHPGGLQWWLRRLGRAAFDVGVAGDPAVALALHDEGDVVLQADLAHSADRDELLAWVETRARAAGEREIFVSIAEDDAPMREIAAGRGYEPADRYGYELVFELGSPPRAPKLPPGFVMRSLAPDLADRYVELHRSAWSRPGSPSTYDRRQHDAVTAMPDFRYDSVPIAVAPDGTLAAYCMSWFDARSRSVEIEPLGTHPEFRRLGLARAIVLEVFRRAAALGAASVMVWGGSSNAEAKALYESAGMRSRRVLRDWRLAL